ncbi:MAG TPA: GntR family transcriptional regulator [Kiloniellaceae bacterium]|nr:GntR family transcriptional regulator [Kiloniellaceae bacterium]
MTRAAAFASKGPMRDASRMLDPSSEMPPDLDYLARYWRDEPDAPKHEQVRRMLAEAIADGYWKPGSRLPTEAELARALPFGLATIQRAFRGLVEAGLVTRRRGSGSVVAFPEYPLRSPWHLRFHRHGETEFLSISAKIVERWTTTAEGIWSEILQQGGRELVVIDRNLRIDGQMDVPARLIAVSEEFPDLVALSTADLDGFGLKIMIARRERIRVHRIEKKVYCRSQLEAAGGRQLAGRKTAFILQAVAYAANDRPLYVQEFAVPENDYVLELT